MENSFGIGFAGLIWVFWIVLIGLAAWLGHRIIRRPDLRRAQRQAALRRLDEQYVCCRIGEEEYIRQRHRLLGT